jgi:hypothetical protein
LRDLGQDRAAVTEELEELLRVDGIDGATRATRSAYEPGASGAVATAVADGAGLPPASTWAVPIPAPTNDPAAIASATTATRPHFSVSSRSILVHLFRVLPGRLQSRLVDPRHYW